MSKLRKQFIGILAVLFCALLALSATLIIPKNKAAEAATATTVGEIYDTDNNPAKSRFNYDNLQKLYAAITGNPNATFDNVKTLVSTTDQNGIPNAVTAATIYSNNGNNNVSVTFGGKRWYATYLTRARDGVSAVDTDGDGTGDVVLDLWQMSDDISTTLYQYSLNGSNTWTAQVPGNMYSTSYVRAFGLNAVGSYLAANGNTTSYTQQSGHMYARFTMPALTNSLTRFLVQPANVAYQELERSNRVKDGNGVIGQFLQCPNDAYGNVGDGVYATDSISGKTLNYSGKGSYDLWKNDYLWLASVAETGNIDEAGANGIWETNVDIRRATTTYTWSRSGCNFTVTNPVNSYTVETTMGTSPFQPVTTPYGVRPALHLNLTKADEDSRKLFFGTSDTTDDTDNNVKIAKIEHDYDNTAVTINVPDFKYLDFTDIKNVNNVNNIKLDGVFSATAPDTTDDKTYEISVTPQTITQSSGYGFYWADATNATEKTAARHYRIKISLAEIVVDWKDIGRSSGESVLQTNGVTTVNSEPYDEKYKVVTNSSDYLPDDTEQWQTGDWQPRADGDAYFKVSSAVKHCVYYEITADYHKPYRGHYDVTVTADTAKFTADSADAVTSEEYASDEAGDLITQTKLKELFGDHVTMTTTNNTTTWSALKSKVDVKLFIKDDNGNRTNIDIPSPVPNNWRLDAGEYYMYLDWSTTTDASQKTVSFNWAESTYAKFEITPKAITVGIVEENGGSLTHVYGDNPAKLKYTYSGLADGDSEDDLNLGSIVIEGQTNSVRKSSPVDTYTLTGKQTEVGNYKVTFSTATYVVTKRPVKLKLQDEEMEYGKDFASFTFKALTNDMIVDGNIVDGDTLEGAVKSKDYYLELNSTDVDEKELFIQSYELLAKFESDNYEFTVEAAVFKVVKANFDMSGVTLTSKGYVYDGQPHAAQINGTLPSDEITVSYRYVNTEDGSESTEPPVEKGLYLVYASFTHSNGNYNDIAEKVAYIRIADTAEEANQPFPQLPTDEDIANAADLAKKKTEAKKTLDEEAQKKKGEIDADVNLTAEEKKAAKDEIDKELKEGNAAIDKAKDKDGVDKAYDDGKKEIEDTTELAKSKGAAKSELDKAAQAKKEAIDNNPDLTDEEKAAAKAEVDRELEEGKKAIDGATDVNSVQSTESTTKTNIENIEAEHKGSFPWWILALIAGAILLGTVILIVIVKRRNADDDDGGYDDYYDDEYDYDEEEDDGDEAFEY